MAAIDFIEVGKPMPDWIQDYVPKLKEPPVEIFISVDVRSNEIIGFSYVPYVPQYINTVDMSKVDTNEIVSSRFSGCLMVAWEDAEGLFVGHVHTGDSHDCKEKWNERKEGSYRSFQFKPFDHVPTVTVGHEPNNCYGFIEIDDANNIIAAFSVFADLNDIVTVKKLVYKGYFRGHIEV